MALLENVKVALRVKSTAFDAAEITPIISACKLDLELAGVNVIDDNDPLIQRAIIMYSKAHFGFADDSEKWAKAYEMQKNSLALAGDYNTIP